MPFGSDFGSLADLPMNLGRSILGAGQTMLSAPRQALWDVGPSVVGRSGQGPQSGAEALQRLGLDYNSAGQRAIGHGLGRGLDLVADPMNLVGMGAVRGSSGVAPAAEASGALTRRLESMVAPVTEANAAGRPVAQARIDNWMQGVGHPEALMANRFPRGGEAAADAGQAMSGTIPNFRPPGTLPFTPPPELIPGRLGAGQLARSPASSRAGMSGSVPNFAYDADALRQIQLNSPHFNPNTPAFGLGTSQFTQDASAAARHGLESAPGLTTQSFMQPTAEAASPVSQTLLSRLQRMAPPAPRVDY